MRVERQYPVPLFPRAVIDAAATSLQLSDCTFAGTLWNTRESIFYPIANELLAALASDTWVGMSMLYTPYPHKVDMSPSSVAFDSYHLRQLQGSKSGDLAHYIRELFQNLSLRSMSSYDSLHHAIAGQPPDIEGPWTRLLVRTVGANLCRVQVGGTKENVYKALSQFDAYTPPAPYRPLSPFPPAADEQPAQTGGVPRVFIGHGHDPAWRDLKDHLQDKHGIPVVAFEAGERGGHTIRDILEEMMRSASLAFLILTKEDEMLGGQLRARQNVVHEAGLFQGRLGFSRAIAVVQAGAEVFSNIAGVQQLVFRSSIQEIFGDALAVYRREFGATAS